VLEALARAKWKALGPGVEGAVRREALELLDSAERLARAEQAGQLLRNVGATRKKIELEGDDDVQA